MERLTPEARKEERLDTQEGEWQRPQMPKEAELQQVCDQPHASLHTGLLSDIRQNASHSSRTPPDTGALHCYRSRHEKVFILSMSLHYIKEIKASVIYFKVNQNRT